MPAMLRSNANRGLWAVVVGLGLAAIAVGQPPDDPIATSNKLTELPAAPSVTPSADETPWLAASPDSDPVPPTPSARALLERIISKSHEQQPKPVDPPQEPQPRPIVAEPREPQPKLVIEEPREPQPKPIVAEPREPQPAPTSPVNWAAPGHREPVTSRLPTFDRPMIPCEPSVDLFHSPAPAARPMAPLPPPRQLSPGDGEPQTATAPQPTLTPAPDDDPPPRVITTIRFVDDTPPPPSKSGTDDPIIAIIRRGGSATGTAADIRAAVERICRGKGADCQTEVAGERQVRVLLKVRTEADWRRLYERMQNLPELGEYGLIFEVRVEN